MRTPHFDVCDQIPTSRTRQNSVSPSTAKWAGLLQDILMRGICSKRKQFATLFVPGSHTGSILRFPFTTLTGARIRWAALEAA